MCAEDTTLFYPDFNKTFDAHTDFNVHTNASEYQLGVIISQEGRPIAYYSKKLTSMQKKYLTIKQELFRICVVLKELRQMLLGQKRILWTDHKNLTYTNSKHANNQVLRQ